ncbi:MAG: rRNA pseudouridine synthase [Bryobacterales bacterium]|nr:rRNA pseudouridine synthase [Bryobacterales bacterium]
MAQERLQKILAHAGISSRRHAEEYILAGRVKVNGKVVDQLGAKADPTTDHIKVDGKLINVRAEKTIYLALHKPKAVVTTVSDPEGRETVMQFLSRVKQRVYPVGRLDYQSEGLILLTNDGEFANRVISPKYRVPKTYLVKSTGLLTPEEEAAFAEGFLLEGKQTAPAQIRLVKRAANPWYEVVLTEGRTHQIRKMFRHFGKLVEKLRRVQIGPVVLRGLRPGEYRVLNLIEIRKFRKMLQLPPIV